MVDGTAILSARRNDVVSTKIEGNSKVAVQITIEAASADALDRYRSFAHDCVSGMAQLPLWVECWTEAVRPDALIVGVWKGSRQCMAIPLEVVRRRGAHVASFMGRTHANGNFPVLTRDCGPLSPIDLRKAIAKAVSSARPDIDLILLERQIENVDGVPNPFAAFPRTESVNVALATSLSDGFDGVLERHSGKRRRKKRRYQIRKFEQAGGYRRITARAPDEVKELLEAFLRMKAARLEAFGLPDTFSPDEIKQFLALLFLRATTDKASFFLDGLEVGGQLRAVTGSSQAFGRIVCEFGAISDDELTAASPGEFLFFDNILEACQDGYQLYDFSVGDEPYKRMWSDIEIRQFDCWLPLTARGRYHAGLHRLATSAKRRFKSSPKLRELLRNYRLRSSGTAQERGGEF
jgi:CelD/BcsL family acetyltransferase involved in cellulose biosynthesis